jgi:glycosyltransferase involved in cell wall biosynthesis
MAAPRVSVVMCVYDGARYLDEAVASILGQTWRDLELIIVDDGSRDETPAILTRWMEADSRVRVITFEENRGVSQAANRGMHEARGEYIARHDSDDVSAPERIERQVAVLDSEPGVVLVATNFTLTNAKGKTVGYVHRSEPRETVSFLQRFFNFVGAGGHVMFRRDLVLSLGGYREDYRFAADYDLWTKLIDHGDVVILPYHGLRYRLHEGSVGSRWWDLQQALAHRTRRETLSAYLGRTLSDEEMRAVDHLFGAGPGRGLVRTTHSLLREAWAKFAELASHQARKRARVVIAQRMVIIGGVMLRRGAVVDALLHAIYAVRWHPRGIVEAGIRVAQRTWYRVF